MKFSEQWLREFIDPPITIKQLAEQLTLAGLEVDSTQPIVSDFSGVVVGEVLEVSKHPNAERLSVCKVNVGDAQPLEIVCGAQNVRADLKVPVAEIGAVLPGNFRIKKTKLRGIDSHGMICSESELGLLETSEGIMELPLSAPIGQDIRDYLQLNDHIIDVDLTPNRGDCLSILGIAREVAIANKLEKPELVAQTFKATSATTIAVRVDAPQACPKYIGRIIRNINREVETPLWMKEKLRRSDIRCIHPIVDITNYVMLELGQPLHAFDIDKISAPLEVRFAKQGEGIELLDEQTVTLDDKVLVIADQHNAQAIAGIKGGKASSITSDTNNIFLESALFNSRSISSTARRFGLYTDSSQRFERGVDPLLQQSAIERATQLIVEIVGGEVCDLIVKESEKSFYTPPSIDLRFSQVQRVLGINLGNEQIINLLKQLNVNCSVGEDGCKATPPSYRLDLNTEIDLIEEIARVYGYQNIPSKTLVSNLVFTSESETLLTVRRISDLMVDQGYQETITYSFVDPKLEQLLSKDKEPLVLQNPISNDLSVMRTNLWPGLLSTYLYNEKRQHSRVRLFEVGMCFKNEANELVQQNHVGGLISGSIFPEQWGEKNREVDFFDIKKDVENMLGLTGKDFRYKRTTHPALHPGKSAVISHENETIGYMGCLNPEIAQRLDIGGNVYLFEVNLERILTSNLPRPKRLSKFPTVRRDLAILVSAELPVDEILEKILDSAGDLLKNVHVFDVYQGKGINPGKKSIALGLIFQHESRTLVDAEINEFIQKLISELETNFNATLRD